MQINRLFEIVHLLMNKKRVTANELAEHFEVSKRTILRDIDTLTTAGIPIYTIQGKGGGIFIQDNFVLNKTLVSEDEKEQILFSLQSMSATEFIDTGQVLGRLRSFFQSPGKEWVEVDFSRWVHGMKSFCLTENDYRIFIFTHINNMAVLDKSFHSVDYEIPLMQ